MARVAAAARRPAGLGHAQGALHTGSPPSSCPPMPRARQRAGLDFDDLILRTRDLLTDRRADWVLYKLDGGLDHILVDEAQDTSPDAMAGDRAAGAGIHQRHGRPAGHAAHDLRGGRQETVDLFLPGRRPGGFDRMKADVAERLSRTRTPLQDIEMPFSFRSAQVILDVVDATFAGYGDSGFAPDQGHIAFKSAMPGRVDLWPPEEKPEKARSPTGSTRSISARPNDAGHGAGPPHRRRHP